MPLGEGYLLDQLNRVLTLVRDVKGVMSAGRR